MDVPHAAELTLVNFLQARERMSEILKRCGLGGVRAAEH